MTISFDNKNIIDINSCAPKLRKKFADGEYKILQVVYNGEKKSICCTADKYDALFEATHLKRYAIIINK